VVAIIGWFQTARVKQKCQPAGTVPAFRWASDSRSTPAIVSATADNVSRLIDLGVIGINFEDRVVKGSGLYSVGRQARRLGAIRKTAERMRVDLFVNARTDVFFEHGEDAAQAIYEALERAKAYAAAGASGFFIPGLTQDALIGQLCEAVTLPVNVMVMDGVPPNERLSKLGVARISYGPIPYIGAMSVLQQEAKKVLS
jgi:2-methylisocitrate lyase-like PEP mutase family enzyme